MAELDCRVRTAVVQAGDRFHRERFMSRACIYSTATALWAACFADNAAAADHLDLAVVKPVISCEQLAKAPVERAEDAEVTIDSATTLQTPTGAFCKVEGRIGSVIGFRVALPVEHWTQRFAQTASTQDSLSVSNSGSCAPATNGELATASNDRGGDRRIEPWKSDAYMRIDWAYLANHKTTLVAKALIKTFYGQGPRFAYFVGCSGGGREALIVAQRYPDDFNGVSAGAPAALVTVHNGGFYHGWEAAVNRRADGSIILARERLGILHQAAVEHCAEQASALDGILQVPNACTFDPAWVRCPAGAPDTIKCLTAEETAVAQKLYEGASDAQGRHFELGGFPLGSEMMWALSTPGSGSRKPGHELKYLLPLSEAAGSIESLEASFRFSQEWFDRLGVLAPLYNGANTNLRRFQQRGGKLILWHGAADTMVQPAVSIAYYQGVQKELGVKQTDAFMRFFMLPGVAHCSGGEGPAQFDTLSPLMAWTELQQAPESIVAGKPVNQRSGIPGRLAQNAGAAPAARWSYPYSQPNQPAMLMRPIYPYPTVARYTGKGDRNDAANYRPAESSAPVPQVFNTEAAKLIGPNNQTRYRAKKGELVAEKN
ncbi:MAG: tannase/feruloyl esterase family alpha/beta hydrolase [Gammaproteobacteria bacterium]|nr:tannase/feruloyl esterase family alpha/beta hydrolase [Gammaproteobacteria bacterium]